MRSSLSRVDSAEIRTEYRLARAENLRKRIAKNPTAASINRLNELCKKNARVKKMHAVINVDKTLQNPSMAIQARSASDTTRLPKKPPLLRRA